MSNHTVLFAGGSHHESEDNWVFALKHARRTLELDDLTDAVGQPEQITVMSDRDKGLIAALPRAVRIHTQCKALLCSVRRS